MVVKEDPELICSHRGTKATLLLIEPLLRMISDWLNRFSTTKDIKKGPHEDW